MCLRKSVCFSQVRKKKKYQCSFLISIHSAILDSGCSSTVAGEQWIACYLDSFTPDELAEVKREPSDTVFKFGGGEQIKSSEKLTLPCWSAGVKCLIQIDIVNSKIPLLLTKTAMKKTEMELDLVHDKAKVFGKEVPLQNTGSAHYIVSMKETLIPIEQFYSSVKTLKKKQKW